MRTFIGIMAFILGMIAGFATRDALISSKQTKPIPAVGQCWVRTTTNKPVAGEITTTGKHGVLFKFPNYDDQSWRSYELVAKEYVPVDCTPEGAKIESWDFTK